MGFNLNLFVNKLKEHYMSDEKMSSYINELVIEGEDAFSIIKNIPDIEIDGKKLITIFTNDLIRLLYN